MKVNVSRALNGLLKTLTIYLVTQSVVDFRPSLVEEEITISGNKQPLDPQELKMTPEEFRQWSTVKIMCQTSEKAKSVKNGDLFIFNSIKYKVFRVFDFSDYGYIEWHCIEGYHD